MIAMWQSESQSRLSNYVSADRIVWQSQGRVLRERTSEIVNKYTNNKQRSEKTVLPSSVAGFHVHDGASQWLRIFFFCMTFYNIIYGSSFKKDDFTKVFL